MNRTAKMSLELLCYYSRQNTSRMIFNTFEVVGPFFIRLSCIYVNSITWKPTKGVLHCNACTTHEFLWIFSFSFFQSALTFAVLATVLINISFIIDANNRLKHSNDDVTKIMSQYDFHQSDTGKYSTNMYSSCFYNVRTDHVQNVRLLSLFSWWAFFVSTSSSSRPAAKREQISSCEQQ